jgi:folate-binding protein YgfZ
MNSLQLIALNDRAVISVKGPDARSFLQGLISNDVEKVAADRAVYSAFLTAQGRFLHDFFVAASGDALWLDVEAARADDLRRRLSIFRLRAKATLALEPDLAVEALVGDGAAAHLGLSTDPGQGGPLDGGVAFVDPRLAAMGVRIVRPRGARPVELARIPAGEPDAYDRLRLMHGLPDGSRDLPVEKAILLENGFDELNGIDWKKGCYVGQELTARTKYRGLVRKRLMPVMVDGPLPAPGTVVTVDGQDAGEMRSGRDGRALALLRLEQIERASREGLALVAGEARLTPERPAWASF